MTTAITITNRSKDRYVRVNYVLQSEDRIADGAKMPSHTETLLEPGEESCLLHVYPGTSIRIDEGSPCTAPINDAPKECIEPVYSNAEDTDIDL